MNEQQREQFAKECEGKTIKKAIWEDSGKYWVLEFTEGTEMCVRLMVDLVNS